VSNHPDCVQRIVATMTSNDRLFDVFSIETMQDPYSYQDGHMRCMNTGDALSSGARCVSSTLLSSCMSLNEYCMPGAHLDSFDPLDMSLTSAGSNDVDDTSSSQRKCSKNDFPSDTMLCVERAPAEPRACGGCMDCSDVYASIAIETVSV